MFTAARCSDDKAQTKSEVQPGGLTWFLSIYMYAIVMKVTPVIRLNFIRGLEWRPLE